MCYICRHFWISAQITEHLSRTTLETFVTSSGMAKEGPTRKQNCQKKTKVLSSHTAMLIDLLCPCTFVGQGFKRMRSGCSVLRQEEHGMYLLVSIR